MEQQFVDIYNFIAAYKEQYGYSPTQQDIAEAMHLSKAQVFYALEMMEDLGMLVVPRGLLQAIKLRPHFTPALPQVARHG